MPATAVKYQMTDAYIPVQLMTQKCYDLLHQSGERKSFALLNNLLRQILTKVP